MRVAAPVSRARIVRLVDVAPGGVPDKDLEDAIEGLFFAASNTQDFSSEAERTAHRSRWLTRYLEHYGHAFFLALSPEGELLGYLAGALDDPARTPLFSDLDYFQQFAALCAEYPAQFHVNVLDAARGSGIGRALVDEFAAFCAQSGARGIHVITALGAPNTRFYEACGFSELGRSYWEAEGRMLVFLGKPGG